MPRNRSLSLTVQYATRDGILPERADIGRWARSAFIDRPPGGGEVTVRFVDVEEARDLNRTYRNRDYATNILSFPYDRTPVLTGDLVVCADVVLREAGEQNKLPLAHYAHLIVHGMLHLQGFEHETGAEDAVKMETAERNILAGLGFPDPYTEI